MGRRLCLAACCGVLLLSSCSRNPQPSSAPNQPPLNSGTSSPEAGQRPAPGSPQQRLSRAEDLFNRGENDLACQEVRQAAQLRRSGARLDAAGQRELQQFADACSYGP